MKYKIISLLLLFVSFFWFNASVFANQDFNITNNEWTLEVTTDTILVWDALKNTSIIDLFDEISIDWKDVSENTITNLDVRYITPDNIDYKVSEDTDIILKDSKVYVLFKSIDNGWTVSDNSTINFTVKNLELKEVWTVSNIEDNSYTKVYDVKYVEKEISNNNENNNILENELENEIIDNNILEENNTGIKDNILYIVIWMFILILSFSIKDKNITT